MLRVGGHEEEALAGRRLGTAKRESEGKEAIWIVGYRGRQMQRNTPLCICCILLQMAQTLLFFVESVAELRMEEGTDDVSGTGPGEKR